MPERVRELRIGQDYAVIQRSQESRQCSFVARTQIERTRRSVRRLEAVVQRGAGFHAAVVMLYHLLQRGKTAVVHESASQANVLQCRRFEHGGFSRIESVAQ